MSSSTIGGLMMRRKNASQSATFVVAASNSLHQGYADYVCDGTDDQVEIQAAIDAAYTAGGGKVALLDGTYTITATITGKDYVDIEGMGFGTIWDISTLGNKNTIEMGDYSSLSNLKVVGSISPFGSDFWRAVVAGNHCFINNIWIHETSYGIDTLDRVDVHVSNYIATNLRSVNDWAAAFHASGSSFGISLRNFYFEGCNRGSEVEDGAQWVIVENGYMKDIQDYNSTGNDSFAMDAHSHSTSPVKHIRYRNIYAENTYPPQSLDLGTAINEDIVWENIQLNNSSARIIINGKNIIMRNVYGYHLTEIDGAESVLIEKSEHAYQYAGDPSWDIGNVKDVTIRDCRIPAHYANPYYGININSATAEDIRILDNYFTSTNFPAAINIQNAAGGIIIKGNKIDSSVSVVTGLTELATAYDKYSDLFMDVLAASTDAVHAAITGNGSEQEITTGITNPDVARNISITNSANSTGDVTIEGIDAKGNSVSEAITIVTGGTAYGNVAFATVTKITIPATVANPDTISVGFSDKLGLSNVIYEAGDVYKVKKNNADTSIGTVNTTYGTVDCSTITGGDDFTIWYKSNLNIIS